MQGFFDNLPKLHSWDGGTTWNTGGFSGKNLQYMTQCISKIVGEAPRICETGAGNSTIAFLLLQPKELVSIAPSKELFQRINKYCDEKAIDRQVLHAVTELSEVALPKFALPAVENNLWFDVGFIDGGHGWPTVFVDFCYIHAIIRQGGVIILDDIQLYSVKELVRFLLEDLRFELAETIAKGKTLAFQKKSSLRFLPDFGAQPYVKRRTAEEPQSTS